MITKKRDRIDTHDVSEGYCRYVCDRFNDGDKKRWEGMGEALKFADDS